MPEQPPPSLRHRPSIVTRRLARARYGVLLGFVLLTLGLGWRASKLGFDFSVDAVYAFDDPDLQFERSVVAPAFGSGDNLLVVLLSAEPLFSSAVLADLGATHVALGRIEGVAKITSLINVRVPLQQGEAFALAPLFDPRQASRALFEPEQMRRIVADTPLLRGRLISDDLGTTALVLALDAAATTQAQRSRLVSRVKATLADLRPRLGSGVNLRLSGIPVISDSITQVIKRDQLTFVPGVLGVMGLLLWLAFRSIRGVLLPFLATGTATLWTLGVMNLEGHAINVANNAIIVLLLVIGVSDAIHLLSRFGEELRRQREAGVTVGKLKTVAVVSEHLGVACLLTSVTTAIGFASLIVAKLEVIENYGIDAAIGVMLAYLVTVGGIPALLAILPIPPAQDSDARNRDLSDRLLGGLAQRALDHRPAVIVMALAVVALSLWGASRIQTHDRILAELPQDHPAVATLQFATHKLGGFIPFDVVIETPPGRADDPDILAAAGRLQDLMAQRPQPPRTLSVTNLLRGVDHALNTKAATAELSSWSPEKIAQYLLVLEMASGADQALAPYLSPRRDLLRIAGFGADMGTDRVLDLRRALLERGRQILPADAELHVGGPLMITSNALRFVVHDMVSSLALALVIILVVMGLLFRSIWVGVLALVPNAIPVLMALGVMGFGGISLRPGTAVIFSMALGIAVDNSIHFLARYREELRRCHEIRAAIEAAVRGTGRPILYTTVMLSLGLAVLLASDFIALQHLAILGSITFIAAMVVDLVLLPVLLDWLKLK